MEVLEGRFVCVECMSSEELIAVAGAREHRGQVARDVLEDAGVQRFDDEDDEPR